MGKRLSLVFVVFTMIFIQLFNLSEIKVQAEEVETLSIAGDEFRDDINADGVVDIQDLSQVASLYNVKSTDKGFKDVYDVNSDKIIDFYDMVSLSKKIGTNYIPYRVYQDKTSTSKELLARYKSINTAESYAAKNKNLYVLDSKDKEVWRSRYEAYNGRTLKGRFNILDEAKASAGNIEGAYVRDASNSDKVVWQYVDPTVYGIVTASTLNVRSGPGTNYSIMGSLSSGSKVEILDSSNSGWHKIKYGSGSGYVSKSYIEIKNPTPPPIPPLPGERRVVIDPGHGGSDPGAIGPGGTREKDVVLKVGLKVRNLLELKGYDVIMTRDTDVFLELAERREISNASGADFFVSIHANAYNATANGTETFGNPSFSKSWSFANTLQRNMVNSFGLRDRGRKDGSNLAVIRANEVPAALVELAFISNPSEEALLKSDSFQTKAAQAIVKSIEESY